MAFMDANEGLLKCRVFVITLLLETKVLDLIMGGLHRTTYAYAQPHRPWHLTCPATFIIVVSIKERPKATSAASSFATRV
ncbi:MAG: hypothetical protein M1834_007731 [Cirrosporium novae-zelandiae]|nr:MAG: hypothetical protein M1834_007731 [Cirrosporium novae-zelandiae]